MSNLPVLLGLFLLALFVAALGWRTVSAARVVARRRAELDARQRYLQGLVDQLRDALADPTLTTDAAETLASALLDLMREQNRDGVLDAFIADNAQSVAEAIAARRAGGAAESGPRG